MRNTSPLHFVVAFSLLGSSSVRASDVDPIRGDITVQATRSLEANIVTLPTGLYLSAGPHQFKGFWTRDFCFASRGLLAIHREDVVKSELERILSLVRPQDGLVPRFMDNHQVLERYFALLKKKNLPIEEPLVPNYSGGGQSKDSVIDSNSLVILAALDYVKATGDQVWWNEHEDQLVRVFRNHDQYIKDGLIFQGEAADWQDSVKRIGYTFYTNLFYWAAANRLIDKTKFGVQPSFVAELKTRIIEKFKDPKSGLYFSIFGYPQISLDGLLLAIDLGFHAPDSPEAQALYHNLKQSILWKANGMPGFATYPDYPVAWVQPLNILSGMMHYHDRMYWSWLMALSAKISYLMNDFNEGERILKKLEELAQRDGGISEVFSFSPKLKPVRTLIYRSERPFSWGAGILLDTLETRKWAKKP